MATKTTTVRLPKDMLEQIDERCQEGGCNRNDWIKNALDNQLELELDEGESQDQEPPTGTLREKKSEPQKITVFVSPEEEEGLRNGTWEIKQKPVEVENIRVSYDDGKTWHDTNTIS